MSESKAASRRNNSRFTPASEMQMNTAVVRSPITAAAIVAQMALFSGLAALASAEERPAEANASSSRPAAEWIVLPFEGAWAPEDNPDPCAPIRQNAAEGDFFVFEDRRLITGAEFGCQIEELVEQPAQTFYLRLHCGGANAHFTGARYGKLIIDSPNRLRFRWKGDDVFVPHLRCAE